MDKEFPNEPLHEIESQPVNPLVNEPDTIQEIDLKENNVGGIVKSEGANYLENIALEIFALTQPLHELDDLSREVLIRSAKYQKTQFPRNKKPLKAIRKIVRSSESQELRSEVEELLVPVVGLWRRFIKRKDLRKQDLTPVQQRTILTLASFLRIASGLDASDSQTTKIIKIEASKYGVWIVIDGPNALRDSAAAQNQAQLWKIIGYPDIKVLEVSKAQSVLYPDLAELDGTGILPDDPLAEAGRKVMRYQFASMLRHEEGTRKGEDIESLHDMRVATRRLRAAFEVFSQAFDPKTLKPYLKGLRATGRALGNVRDLDVMQEKAEQYLQSLPGEDHHLNPLFEAWQAERDQARVAMIEYLDSQEYQVFKHKFSGFLNTSGMGAIRSEKGNPTASLVKEIAPALIYERLANVRAFGPYISDATTELLHALRIEFKKLRYTIEYFNEVLGIEAKQIIEQLKGMQDHLGDLNDAEVVSERLKNFLSGVQSNLESSTVADNEIRACEGYLAYRQTELARLVHTFPEVWIKFERPQFRRDLAKAVSKL